MNRIKPQVEAIVRRMLSEGKSYRTIKRVVPIASQTIVRIARKNPKSGDLFCDNCRVREIGPRAEYLRPTRRTKHKFCSTYCYGEFRRRQNEHQECKRCGVIRKDMFFPQFSLGYCGTCYGKMRELGFDKMLVDLHDTNVRLKKEIKKHGDQKYGRPSKDAD